MDVTVHQRLLASVFRFVRSMKSAFECSYVIRIFPLGVPSDQSSGTSSPLCDSGLHLNYHPNNTVHNIALPSGSQEGQAKAFALSLESKIGHIVWVGVKALFSLMCQSQRQQPVVGFRMIMYVEESR